MTSTVHTTVITNTPTTSPIVVTQPVPPANVIETYNAKQSRNLGITQVIGGISFIVLSAIFLGRGNVYGWFSLWPGHGIAGGIWFIITGGFGIGASSSKSRCLVITYMVLAILACIEAFALFCIFASGIAAIGEAEIYIFLGLYIILSVTEFVCALWGSILCCTCCKTTSASTGFVMQSTVARPGYVPQPGYAMQPAVAQPGYVPQPGYAMQPAVAQPLYVPQPGYSMQPGVAQPGYVIQPPPAYTAHPSDAQPGYAIQPGGGQPGYAIQPGGGQPGSAVQPGGGQPVQPGAQEPQVPQQQFAYHPPEEKPTVYQQGGVVPNNAY